MNSVLDKYSDIKCVLITISLLLFSFSLSATTQEQNQVKIIFASDMNEISSVKTNGYASTATLLKQHKKQKTPTFFFFGGGSIGPSMLSAFDRGSHIIDLLNAIEPDVMAATKRDFSFLEDELSLRSYEAAFPIVASNIVDNHLNDSLDGLTPYVITQQGKYRIGVLSTLSASTIQEYNLKRVSITNKVESVTKYANILKDKNVDLVVLINTGIENDVVSLLENGTVDIILQKDSNVSSRITQSIPVHARFIFVDNIDDIALIKIAWDNTESKNITVKTSLHKYSTLIKDDQIEKMVARYEGKLGSLLNDVIGTTTTSMDTQRAVVRKQESAFGNLVTDAMKSYTDADIAILNGGTIRGETIYIPGQNISRRDIINELPYRNNIVMLNISGKELYQAVEHGLSGIDSVLGRFLQMSGLTIEYKKDNPIGHRLVSLKHLGVKVEPNAQFKVAMSDYLSKGGDDFTMWNNPTYLNFNRYSNALLSEVVINYIRESGFVSPTIENRIMNVSNQTLKELN